MFRKVFPRICTNLQSSPTARNFNNSRTIYVIHGKWEIITEIFDSWKVQNITIFYIWKTAPKIDKVCNFLPYIQIIAISVSQKLDILIFCNILPLEIDFWILSSKRIVPLGTFWQKCHEKHYKWNIEKNGIAYSTVRNLKRAYLWTFISIRITRNNTFYKYQQNWCVNISLIWYFQQNALPCKFHKKFEGLLFIFEKFLIIYIGEAVKLYQYIQNLFWNLEVFSKNS